MREAAGRGRVYLVGAGPGDPDLMTFKAARALQAADVILIDDLANRACLAHAREGAKVIEVGKRGGCASTPQAFIEKLMVQYAKAGNVVARLKGGDPFVFGRGGEEHQALVTEGIAVEVIPGVTAGIAAPAMLGIPVTHREIARGVTFVTGHTTDGGAADWDALARSGTTLVIYMGVKHVESIALALVAAGMAPETPACVIENGTLARQREVVSTLASLGRDVKAGKLQSPAIIVVGEVVRFAQVTTQRSQARAA